MDESKKPFDAVWIIFLILIALANDGAEIFFDLLAMTGVGLVGEAIMEPVNVILDGFFTGVFVMKCGFGGPSILQLVDDLLELIGIPGRTACAILGVLMANNSKVAKLAALATAVETGGAGEIAEAGEAAEGAAAVAGEGAAAAEGAGAAATAEEGVQAGATETAEAGVPTEGGPAEEPKPEGVEGHTPKEAAEERAEEEPQGLPSETEEETGGESEEGKEGEDISATESEESPEEIAKRKLFEEVSGSQDQEEGEEENGEGEESEPESQTEPSQPDNLASGDEFARRQKALEVKREQESQKPAKEATGERDVDTLKKAA